MYKNKDKQREAQREWVRQKRGSTPNFNAGEGSERLEPRAPFDCSTSKPDGTMAIETLVMMDAGCGNKLTHGLKRGKDIKSFADLSPDVQLKINRQSLVNNEIDQTIKANRTAIAIDYQHKHPDRYEPLHGAMEGGAR